MPSFLNASGTYFSDGGNNAPVTVTPTAGQTVSMSGFSLFLTPAGTLATLTVNLPPNAKPGQTATITSTQAVTTLTVHNSSGTATQGPSPTALVAYTEVRMRWMPGWNWIRP
jgi:hypothetical protein